MRSVSKFLLALLVAITGVLTATGPASASPPTPTDLGGLNLGAYCRSIGYADATLTGPTAYDWHCVSTSGQQGALAFDAACRWTYSTGDAVDRIGDFYDPASVRCWLVQPDVVTPVLADYCTGQGYADTALLGKTVYDWRCVRYSRGGPTYYDIDIAAACTTLTRGYAKLDRFVNFHDPYSWQCRA